MQFIRSKGYLTIQATEEGYSFIFYDSYLHEIHSGDYDNPDASIQEAAYEILKSERMDDLECVNFNNVMITIVNIHNFKIAFVEF